MSHHNVWASLVQRCTEINAKVNLLTNKKQLQQIWIWSGDAHTETYLLAMGEICPQVFLGIGKGTFIELSAELTWTHDI